MANSKFTKHAISVLKKNPNVEKVSEAKITYTQEFIDKVVEGIKKGEDPVEIFEANGFSVKVLGKTRINGSVSLWKSRYEIVTPPRKRKVVAKPAKETTEQRQRRLLGSAILHCDSLMENPDKIKDFDKAKTDEEKRFVAIRQTYLDRKKNSRFIVKDLIEYYGLNYDKYFTFLRKINEPDEPEYVNILKKGYRKQNNDKASEN